MREIYLKEIVNMRIENMMLRTNTKHQMHIIVLCDNDMYLNRMVKNLEHQFGDDVIAYDSRECVLHTTDAQIKFRTMYFDKVGAAQLVSGRAEIFIYYGHHLPMQTLPEIYPTLNMGGLFFSILPIGE